MSYGYIILLKVVPCPLPLCFKLRTLKLKRLRISNFSGNRRLLGMETFQSRPPGPTLTTAGWPFTESAFPPKESCLLPHAQLRNPLLRLVSGMKPNVEVDCLWLINLWNLCTIYLLEATEGVEAAGQPGWLCILALLLLADSLGQITEFFCAYFLIFKVRNKRSAYIIRVLWKESELIRVKCIEQNKGIDQNWSPLAGIFI